MFMFSSVGAIVLTTTIASVSVLAPSTPAKQSTSAPSTFATLRGVNAVPMATTELGSVKGAHAHFLTVKSKNVFDDITGFHVVNRNNHDNWLDLGNGEIVGPGYHGLCGAALLSPNMLIPGQNPVTGVGGGC
jgi:hypothetical protein